MIDKLLMRLAGLSTQKALIFGAILGAIYFFTMFDSGSAIEEQIQKVQSDIQTQEAKAKESDLAIKEVEKIRASVGALSEQFKVVSQALPSEVQMSDIIRAVDTMAKTSGISIKTKEPRPLIDHSYYEEIPLRITAEGSFAEVTMFLFHMASQERIMKVKSFAVAQPSQQDKSSLGRLQFEGQVVAYRFVIGKKEASKK